MHVIRAGGPLLYHRAVTPLDLIIARVALETIGNLAATALSFLVFYMIGAVEYPHDLIPFMLGLFYMVWWSISVALVLAAWSERSELVQHIWMPISYMYLPICGFFLSRRVASAASAQVGVFRVAVAPRLRDDPGRPVRKDDPGLL